MLTLRYLALGKDVNLKFYYNFIIELYNRNFLIFLTMCLACITIYLAFVQCHLFLRRQIKMRHLHYKYHLYFARILESDQKIKETFYRKMQNKIHSFYVNQTDEKGAILKDFPLRLFLEIFDRSITKLYKLDSKHVCYQANLVAKIKVTQPFTFLYWCMFNDYIHYLYAHPFWLLVVIFIIECSINNFILHITFYFLFFYLIYNTIYNIGDFIKYNDQLLDRIIYARYYSDFQIFLAINEKQEEFILNYIRLGFKPPYQILSEKKRSIFYPIFYKRKLENISLRGVIDYHYDMITHLHCYACWYRKLANKDKRMYR